MKKHISYCRTCGAPAIPEATGVFDDATGKPIMAMVCSSVRCHSGHQWRKPSKNCLQHLFGIGPDEVCVKCGKEYTDYGA